MHPPGPMAGRWGSQHTDASLQKALNSYWPPPPVSFLHLLSWREGVMGQCWQNHLHHSL